MFLPWILWRFLAKMFWCSESWSISSWWFEACVFFVYVRVTFTFFREWKPSSRLDHGRSLSKLPCISCGAHPDYPRLCFYRERVISPLYTFMATHSATSCGSSEPFLLLRLLFPFLLVMTMSLNMKVFGGGRWIGQHSGGCPMTWMISLYDRSPMHHFWTVISCFKSLHDISHDMSRLSGYPSVFVDATVQIVANLYD